MRLVTGDPDRQQDGNAKWETGEIPPALRAQVLERDASTCKVCGAYADSPALHHIVYRSQGGLNVVENLVTVHWMYAPRCHERVHSDKGKYQRILLEIAGGKYTRSTTVFQVLRWEAREKARVQRALRGSNGRR